LVAGTVIANVANIYFDYNEPVITEPSVLVAEFSTGVGNAAPTGIQVFPNPATDLVQVVLPAAASREVAVQAADGRPVRLVARLHARGLELDVAGLAPGLYVVRTPDGTARFVKR